MTSVVRNFRTTEKYVWLFLLCKVNTINSYVNINLKVSSLFFLAPLRLGVRLAEFLLILQGKKDTNQMKLVIEKTADGSPTLYREDIDEHYHSVKGALAESQHVYLQEGWRKASEIFRPVRVFEVGFGSGLNAALTASAAMEEKIPTEYYSVELYPLPKETIELISSGFEPDFRASLQLVNDAPWEVAVEINPYFTLHKLEANLLAMTLPTDLDAVYFDAFAPEKQPEMWSEGIFQKLFDAMHPGGILTTYCAKGAIRRMLQSIGFLTERLPGPPGGKREILRATKPSAVTNC